MDERNIRTERTTTDNLNRDVDVDIRRTMIMGRDLGPTGTMAPTGGQIIATTPGTRALHWGPIWAGLITTLVVSLLLGALFVGVGFTRQAGVINGLTAQGVGWGALIASLIGVFCGAYLTGYVSDLRTRSEGILNGFMVGVMTIFTPVLLALLGGYGAAQTAVNAASNLAPRTANPAGTAATVGGNVAATVPPNVETAVRNALVVAADNAWTVFFGGLLILGLGALAGYLGRKSRETAIANRVRQDLDRANVV